MSSAKHAGQAGFTLIEVLVSVTVGGMLATVLAASIFQLSQASAIGEARLEALHELQRAHLWISGDVHRAETTSVPDGGSTVTTADFNWTEDGNPHQCSYALAGTDLQRTCDGVRAVVARLVTTLEFSRQAAMVTIAVETTAPGDPGVQEQGTLLALLRPA